MYRSDDLGKLGEKIAENYFVKNNYKILNKNYKCYFGEIDLIVKDEKCLIFVEVKTRQTDKYGNGLLAIDKFKQRHIYKTAQFYLYYKKIKNIDIRIDAVEIFIGKNKISLKHYKNIIFEYQK